LLTSFLQRAFRDYDAAMTCGETILAGGRTTRGVVRIGATVRRPPGTNAAFVRSLLRHLEAQGFAGAPRHLGSDEQGREIFTYVPGTVPADLAHHDDAVLAQAANLIRRYHDATATLFATPAAGRVGLEVACHNDLSPCNTVFRDGSPVALIDFDAAAPGSRAFDLGYAAWLWLDIGNLDCPAEQQVRRLRIFLDGYGATAPAVDLVTAMLDRQGIVMAEAARLGNARMGEWAARCRGWTLANLRGG
jgi:hypothetical protein